MSALRRVVSSKTRIVISCFLLLPLLWTVVVFGHVQSLGFADSGGSGGRTWASLLSSATPEERVAAALKDTSSHVAAIESDLKVVAHQLLLLRAESFEHGNKDPHIIRRAKDVLERLKKLGELSHAAYDEVGELRLTHSSEQPRASGKTTERPAPQQPEKKPPSDKAIEEKEPVSVLLDPDTLPPVEKLTRALTPDERNAKPAALTEDQWRRVLAVPSRGPLKRIQYVPRDIPNDVSSEPRAGFRDCQWMRESHYKYDYEKDSQATKNFETIIKLLNRLNIVYILFDGSLLGAYRHGGPIPGDGDMDLVFPLWLNDIVGDCDEKTVLRSFRDPEFLKENWRPDGNVKLCGHTKSYWMTKTQKFIQERQQKNAPDDAVPMGSPTPFGGFRVNLSPGIDFIVSMHDDKLMNHGPVCYCKFGSVKTFCVEGADSTLRAIYGDDYMTFDRDPNVKTRATWEGNKKP